MSKSATFYTITDNPKKLDKTLGTALLATQTIAPYKPLSDLTGIILVDYDAVLESCNYVVMDRNYFITDRTLLTGGKMQLSLRVDVLTTYKDYIKECPAVLGRSANIVNAYIQDSNQPQTVFASNGLHTYDALGFSPIDFNSNGIVFITAG